MTIVIDIPFTEGEIPVAPLTYQYLDSGGAPLVIDETWTATLRLKHSDGTVLELDADLDPTTATALYGWGDGVLDTPGIDKAEFWITDGTQEVASDRIIWRVRAAIPVAGS